MNIDCELQGSPVACSLATKNGQVALLEHAYEPYLPEGGPWIVKGGETMNGQLVPPFDPKGQAMGNVESLAPIGFYANLTLTEGKIVAVAEVSGYAPEPLIVTPGGAGC